MTHQPSPNGLPQLGEGRAYAIASALLENLSILDNRPWLSAALTHFKHAMEQQVIDTSATISAFELWSRLNARFDLDSIVSFSHAWNVWESFTKHQRVPSAWDQELFFGKNTYSTDYHVGIKALAQRQLDFVVPACRAYFKHPVGIALDIGTGLGVQMSALRDAGIISSAICIDTPFVAELGRLQNPEHTWIGEDLRSFNPEAIPKVDLIWIGNLLHHYAMTENIGILNRFAPKLSPDGVVVIQDYVVGSPGLLGLAAAALGVHFALTTNQGMNYTEKAISSLVEDIFPEHILDSRADGQFSSLLFYRKQ